MKWPFWDKFRLKQSSKEKSEGKRAFSRRRRAILIDFVCTVRSRRRNLRESRLNKNVASSVLTPRSTQTELTDGLIIQNTPTQTDWFSKLWPAFPVHDRQSKRDVAVCRTQPAFCPTCQNIVILLPHKRRSTQDPMMFLGECKYMRTDVNSGYSRLGGPLKIQLDRKGYFNPVYDSVHSVSDDSIYCSVESSPTAVTGLHTEEVNSPQIPREKLIAARRRRNHYAGANSTGLKAWLTTVQDSTPTYTDLCYTSSSNIYSTVLSESGDVGHPWSSSTLKSHFDSVCPDTRTEYDDVASDADEENLVEMLYRPTCYMLSPDTNLNGRQKLRRKLMEVTGQDVPAQVKRIRREYFVCEQ